MKTILLVFCAVVGIACAAETGRTYDNDNQHKRSSQDKSSRQLVGYEEIETTSDFWRQKAQSILEGKLAEAKITKNPKNVIYFIGDGMSPQTVAATRVYLGNENRMLSFEEFPYTGTARTYCVNRQVADSACTATAYLSGVKTNYGMINVAAEVPRYNCTYNREETEFLGLLKWAQDNEMATGVVSNARITHATPAGTYASIANRDWEDDSYMARDECDITKYPDIAQQLIHGEVGKRYDVILGGGRRHFVPSGFMDNENVGGSRADGKNLINEWLELHGSSSKYVWNKAELQAVDPSKTDRLLGLFDSSHCLYNLEIDEKKLQDTKPKLTEMVEAAIKFLNKRESGYVLFVEGGKIDMAHHETHPRLALEETAEYSRAIDLARKMTSVEDTLIVVTADHSHTMTYNGYTKRGNDILGIADVSDRDNLPYTTLSYANGEGYYSTYKKDNLAEREDISGYDYTDYRTQYPATVPLSSETHGGEDVTVYASGPMAHLFTGNIEQNVIPDLIAYAAQIGRYKVEKDDDEPGAGSSLAVCVQLAIACLIAAIAGWIKV
uniref:Alkaline phosphatase n=1 Tax=Culex pipiens TaxID=7175 RepID=A0A8D8IF20_CULPI